MPFKSSQVEKPRKLSKFSNIGSHSVGNTDVDNQLDKANSDVQQARLNKYKQADNLDKKAEKLAGTKASSSSSTRETADLKKNSQSKEAIADDNVHDLLAKEAVVNRILRVTGFGLGGRE
uniref:Uncharacterized protein n=1 Tax=Plectus sambesii TaxID=2011161 RepID=A0A914X306_9BILA